MPRTALPIITPPGTNPGTIAAGAADFVWTAADVANKNQIPHTGKELILVNNTDAAAQTVTITSVSDDFNRTGDITAYSLDVGDYAVFGPFEIPGWRQTDGNLYLEAAAATVKFAVIRLP